MTTWFTRSVLMKSILISLSVLCSMVSMIPGTAAAASPRSTTALAETFDLPVPRRLTSFQHPVIYASPDVLVKYIGAKTIIRQTLIIKWGLHVFEVAEGIYQCTGNVAAGFDCEWVDHTRVATYSLCDVSGIARGEKPKCTGQITGNSGPTEDIDTGWDPELERNTNSEWTEFPERSHDPENPVP